MCLSSAFRLSPELFCDRIERKNGVQASSGGVSGAVAQGILAAMPQTAKDKYAAELLNSRAHEVCKKLEAQARREGIGLKIASLHAEVK